jgi:hypothetical protein
MLLKVNLTPSAIAAKRRRRLFGQIQIGKVIVSVQGIMNTVLIQFSSHVFHSEILLKESCVYPNTLRQSLLQIGLKYMGTGAI